MLTYTKDMLKIKNEFIISFLGAMNKNLSSWKAKQAEERKSLYSWSSIKWYLLAALIGFCPGKHERDYSFKFHSLVSIFLFISAIIINIHNTNKSYQNAIKKTFFSDIIKLFGKGINYGPSYYGEELTIPSYVIDESHLYKREIEYKKYDDYFGGSYKGVSFKINEMEHGWLGKDKYGEKTIENTMFKGLALYFELNKTIKNRVLIVSKSLFFRPKKNYQKVEVEYDKFSKKYDVYVDLDSTEFYKKKDLYPGLGSNDASSAQIEARYLLNTAFLDRFMQIQTSFKVNKMQCSILGNDMLMMLSTKRDLFEMNHLLGKIDDVNQYEHLFNEFASIFSFIDVLNLSSKTKL